MHNSFRPRRLNALTRISDIGGRDFYLVKHGDELPIKVWIVRDGLRCECGYAGCAHIASLQMCGFVESSQSMQKAA